MTSPSTMHDAFKASESDMRAVFGPQAVRTMHQEGLVAVPFAGLRRLLLRGEYGRSLVSMLPQASAHAVLLGETASGALKRLDMTLITEGILERAFTRAGYTEPESAKTIEMWLLRIKCAAFGHPFGALAWGEQ